MQEVRVLVPEDRLADFYMWFGGWLEGAEPKPSRAADPTGQRTQWANTSEDRRLAEELWAKLSQRAKALFGHLIDQPGIPFSGEHLAAVLNIPKGKLGVAGVLAWPGRYCAQMGRMLPITWSEQDGVYWIDPDIAQLFAGVR